MKVYYPGDRNDVRMYVMPANDHPDVSDWKDENGKPKMFEIHFKNFVAEVDDNLGRYLIDNKFALKALPKIITKFSKKIKDAILN